MVTVEFLSSLSSPLRKPGPPPQAAGKGPGAPEKANILLLYCSPCHKITSHVWPTSIGSTAFPNIALLSFLRSGGGQVGTQAKLIETKIKV